MHQSIDNPTCAKMQESAWTLSEGLFETRRAGKGWRKCSRSEGLGAGNDNVRCNQCAAPTNDIWKNGNRCSADMVLLFSSISKLDVLFLAVSKSDGKGVVCSFLWRAGMCFFSSLRFSPCCVRRRLWFEMLSSRNCIKLLFSFLSHFYFFSSSPLPASSSHLVLLTLLSLHLLTSRLPSCSILSSF